MSVSTEISRITAAKNKMRTKTAELGITDASANLDTIATAVDGIVNRGTVNANVQEGESVTLQEGYYKGGTVNGVGGGGSYELQAKSVTPTKASQSVTSDAGYYGLSSVEVAAIPSSYQDTSSVTATAPDVLAGKIFVTADGTATAGTMVSKGGVTGSIDGLTTSSYTIPAGYHDGTGTVTLTDDIETALAAI